MRLATDQRQLATGLRIASARDDAAGLGVSERMRVQIRSYQAIERNLEDGISLTQTAEGVLQEVSNMMHRMREIAMQAANGTLNDEDRSTLDTEYEAMAQEIGRVLGEAEFNGHSLFTADGQIDIQVGLDDGPGSTMEINLRRLDWVAGTLDLFDMDNPFEVRFALNTIETFLDVISDQRTEFGVKTNLMQSALSSTLNARENLAAAESRIRDLDMAQATASLTRNMILQQGAIGVLAQAQASPELALILLGAI